jgi:hypothetical protein
MAGAKKSGEKIFYLTYSGKPIDFSDGRGGRETVGE